MKHSTERILVTHVGSLPRPHDLLDMLKARLGGQDVDEGAFATMLGKSVEDMVAAQADAGIDVPVSGTD